MREVVDFSEHTVRRRWHEVKGALREDLTVWTRHYLKRLLEHTLEEEREVYLRAARHERTAARQDYRNGYYTRDLGTELGLLRELRVPRTRSAGFVPTVLDRYQRRRPAVAALLREAFLTGASTRRVGPLLAPLLGERVSASTVSRLTQALDTEVAAFHRRRLHTPILYLLLDGIRLRGKTPTGVQSRLVLCAYGLTPTGQRVLLSFRQAKAESATVGGVPRRPLRPGAHRGAAPAHRDGWEPGAPRRLGARLPLRGSAAVLGPQAPECGSETPEPAPGGLPRGGRADLWCPDGAGRPPGLPGVGWALAPRRPQGRHLSRTRSRGALELLRVPAGAPGEDPHDERHRAGLPGGPPPGAPDDLLHQRGAL